MNRGYFFLWIVLLGFPLLGSAQQIYTLEQCMLIGLQNHIEVKIKSLQIKAHQSAETTLVSRFLPDVSARINHFYNFGSTINPQTNARESSNIQSDNISLDAGIDLFNFEQFQTAKITKIQTAIAVADKAVVDQEFTTLLIQRYTEALAAQELQKVIEDQLGNTKEQLHRIQQEAADGAKPESDVYDIQVLFTQEQKLLLQAQQDMHNKKELLCQLMNKDALSAQDIQLVQDEFGIKPPSERIQWEQHPMIVKESLNGVKLQQEYRSLLHHYLPVLRLNYSYGTFYAASIEQVFDTSFRFGSQLRDNKSQYLGLNLSVPIYSKGDVNRLRRRKNVDILQQQEVLLKKELELNNEWQNQERKYKQCIQLETVLQNAAFYAAKSYEATRVKYEFGKIDISAYKIAKNQLLSAKYDVLNNQLSRWMADKMMQNLMTDRFIALGEVEHKVLK